MSVETFREIKLEQFGGLYTLVAPSDVPPGMSPDCPDVEFRPGGFRTRPGTLAAFLAIAGTPKINGLKSYITLALVQRLLVFTADHQLFAGVPDATLTVIQAPIIAGSYMRSVTAYGAEYIALSDGKGGQDMPWVYDDTALRRCSQEGPGEGPTVTSEGITQHTITTIARAANVVTVTTADEHGFAVGWRAVISQVVDLAFDGDFVIVSVPSTTTFTIAQQAPDATSTGGVVAGIPAYTIAPPSTQQVYISAGTRPWNCAGGQNPGLYFGDGGATGTAPWAIPASGAVSVAYVSGVARGNTGRPWVDAQGQLPPTGMSLDDGRKFPTYYMVDSVGAGLGVVGLCGAFADAWGNVVGDPFGIALGGTFAVPDGATLLLLGVNDTRYGDNGGGFTVETNAAAGLHRFGGVVTAKLAPGQTHTFGVGQKIIVANVDNASFNGTFIVTGVPDSSTLIWSQEAGDAVSGNGSIEAATSVELEGGDRQVAVFFVTATDAWTKVSPPIKFTSYTGHRIVLANIPVGPANVVARGIALSGSAGVRLFHLKSKMYIDDNTTTTLTLDFSEAELEASLPVDYLLLLEPLAAAAAVAHYADRLVWVGEENALPGWRNLSFEGGFATDRPLGWTLSATGSTGGTDYTGSDVWGAAYQITGDGATAVRGAIEQGAVNDAWADVPLLTRNKAYKVRARVKRTAGLVAGRLNIDLKGTAFDTTGLRLTAAQVTEQWVDYEAELAPAQALWPTDLVLRVFADQTPTSDESFLVDNIRLIPSLELVKSSVARISRVGDPEEYSIDTGLISVAQNNGQALRNCFTLRNYLYLVKERSLHVTQDDGASEPSSWAIEEISSTVGTPSVHGVAVGDGWAMIADRKGAYLFRGAAIGDEDRLSNEIQPTWDRINWEGAGHKVWTVADEKRKRVLFGVPLDAATEPSHVLALDYTEGFGDASNNAGVGRKWSVWSLAANSAGVIESAAGPRVFLGSNDASGVVDELREGQLTDRGGTYIPTYYDTAFLGQAGFGRQLFGYMTGAIEGTGKLALSARLVDASVVRTLVKRAMASPAVRDSELGLNLAAERVSFRLQAEAVAGNWLTVAKVRFYSKQDPWAPVRGSR